MEAYIAIAMNVVLGIAILCAGWYAGGYVNKAIQKIDKLDSTLKSFLGGIAKYGILVLSIVTVMQLFGFPTASLIAILGAAGLAIGLALQGTLSNISAGVMLLILRPFNVGDFIQSGSIQGTVKSLGLFATELSTSGNIYIFVPNSNLWNAQIENLSRNKTRRQDIVFGIGYSEDINQAFKTIEKAIKKDDRISQAKGKEPQIMVTNLGASSVDITLRIWSSTSDSWNLKIDTMKNVKEALDKDGISIPFPTRTIEMTQVSANQSNDKKATSKSKAA